MTEETPVAGTTDDPQKTEGAEASDRTESLDDILSSWESQERPTETAKPTETDPVKKELQELKAWKDEQIQEKARSNTEQGVSEAVSFIKELEDVKDLDLDDEVVTGLLLVRAEKNPKFTEAFLSRHTNKEGWNKALGAVGKEIAGKFQKPDKDLSSDREAVKAVVRSERNKAPEPEVDAAKLGKMNDAEFDAYKRDIA